MTEPQIADGLQLLGLIVNGTGALLIALAQQGISREQHQVTNIGPYPFVVLKHPYWWRMGLWLMVGGFCLQAFGFYLRFPWR
jgi:hypothetical protein